MSKPAVYAWRVALLVLFLLGWQFLPKIDALSEQFKFLDPFFISSPSQVAERCVKLLTGDDGSITIWPYLVNTVGATLVGTLIGMVSGMLVGLALSSSKALGDVVGFYIEALNNVPRIALIPVIILVVGVGFATGVVSAVLVVFFLTFFNAFEGGKRVPAAMLANAQIMGASRMKVLFEIRFRYVLVWTFASAPNAISFGLLVVVATELLSGAKGIGQLMLVATSNLDAALTFAVVAFLTVVGTVLLLLAERGKRRVLHWAEDL